MRNAWIVLAVFLGSCFVKPAPARLPNTAPIGVYGPILRVFDSGSFHCTGVLVGPRIALSAAHCFADMNSSGRFYVTRDPHETRNYVTRSFHVPDSDVEILTLDNELPKPYARPGTRLHTYARAWIVGYGCRFDWHGYRQLETRALTALAPAVFAGKACPGDSGGAIYDDAGGLVGITSAISTKGPATVYASDVSLDP
jgi:hypothetical protein